MKTLALFIIVEHPGNHQIGYLRFNEHARARQAQQLLGISLVSDPVNSSSLCRPAWSNYRFSTILDESQLADCLHGHKIERVLWQEVLTGACLQ